jgi:hypothetical protein
MILDGRVAISHVNPLSDRSTMAHRQDATVPEGGQKVAGY